MSKRPSQPVSFPSYDDACENYKKWMKTAQDCRVMIADLKAEKQQLEAEKQEMAYEIQSLREPLQKEIHAKQVVQRALQSLQRRLPFPGNAASRSSRPASPPPPEDKPRPSLSLCG